MRVIWSPRYTYIPFIEPYESQRNKLSLDTEVYPVSMPDPPSFSAKP